MNDAQTPGQIAYAAYRQHCMAYQHHTSGTVMPEPWASLPLLVQMCWEVAADAVLDHADFPPLDLGARKEDAPC
jgi:hypothetical protein